MSEEPKGVYKSTDSKSIVEYNLGLLLAIAEALHMGKKTCLKFLFKFSFIVLRIYRAGIPK